MATKQQVLPLLKKGLSNREIADRLGCSIGYVVATRHRAKYGGSRPTDLRYRAKYREIHGGG
jgi:DNA-binding CsgD family transcriptional regulator